VSRRKDSKAKAAAANALSHRCSRLNHHDSWKDMTYCSSGKWLAKLGGGTGAVKLQ
jgi:hypothetical protein